MPTPKTCLVFLVLLLALPQIQAAPPAAVGGIVTISGNISGINANAGTVSVGYGNTYYVGSSSVFIVNGKPGRIADLANGMKVSGSAEVAKADVRGQPQKQIIRMITATTDPSHVRARPAFTPSEAPPQNLPGVPFPTGSFTPAEMESLAKKLSGTFWTVPNPRVPNGMSAKPWLRLNADGTTTGSASDQTGTWRVVGASTVQILSFTGQRPENARVSFNAELNTGMDSRFGFRLPPPHGPPGMPAPNADPYAWTLIASPTPEMLAKASPRPAATSGTAAVPTPVQPTAESQQAASEVVKVNRNNLVFVTGKEGAGSGFIANMNGTNYLVTNAHVAAGINDADFKTLDGTVVQHGAAGVAVGHDICRMALAEGGKPFEIMTGVDENAGIGDEVVVLGNAEGSGVINTIMGKIVGIGPNLVEVDAQFVPGNSGSPIVHLKTGKVIGVATYTVTRKYDATTNEKMKEPVIRHFGFRVDSVKTWQPVNWPSFYAQAAAMEKVHTLTEALDNFFRDLYENKSHVTVSRHTNPVLKTRIAQWQESKSHKLSLIDRENADANFISFLKIACQSDLTEVQRFVTYDYFQRHLAEEQQTRNEMAKAFTEIIKDIRE